MAREPNDNELEPGRVIDDKYRVVQTLTRGGMGRLVVADHLVLKRRVAIKLLRPGRQKARGRLLREARAMQSLSNEHVVRVFDVGEIEGEPFIVMELLDGRDLSGVVSEDGPLSATEASDHVLEACVAVHEAHQRGIIHRDLKPANLFLANTPSGTMVKVLDFGISKEEAPVDEDMDATAENTILGTPHYISPEQLRNPSKVDGRTDVWALGVTLHHLLTGELPFPGDTSREVTATIFTDAPAPLPADVPDGLQEVVGRALEKLPADRWGDIASFAEALKPFASERGQRAAARIARTGTPAPRRELSATSPGPITETADGVASTLEEQAPSPPPPQSRQTKTLALVGAAACLLAIGVGWPRGEETSAHSVPTPRTQDRELHDAAEPTLAPASAPPSATPTSSAAAPSAAEPSAAEPSAAQPSESARPAVKPSAPQPRTDNATETPASAKPAPSARPPRTSTPAPAESTSVPVDIDGVPILR